MWIFSLFSTGLFSRAVLGVGLFAILSGVGYFAWSFMERGKEVEILRRELSTTLAANDELFKTLENLKLEHHKQMQALWSAKRQSDKIKERVENAKTYIEARHKDGENNLSELFNDLVSRLWSETNDDD